MLAESTTRSATYYRIRDQFLLRCLMLVKHVVARTLYEAAPQGTRSALYSGRVREANQLTACIHGGRIFGSLAHGFVLSPTRDSRIQRQPQHAALKSRAQKKGALCWRTPHPHETQGPCQRSGIIPERHKQMVTVAQGRIEPARGTLTVLGTSWTVSQATISPLRHS